MYVCRSIISSLHHPESLSYCFLKGILKVFPGSVQCVPLTRAMYARKRNERGARRKKKVRFVFAMIERMNTQTTYFKILNTNCAEETTKHHDRVSRNRRDSSIALCKNLRSEKFSQPALVRGDFSWHYFGLLRRENLCDEVSPSETIKFLRNNLYPLLTSCMSYTQPRFFGNNSNYNVQREL